MWENKKKIPKSIFYIANPFPDTEMEGKQNMETHLHFHHLACCPIVYIMVSAWKVKWMDQLALNKNQVFPGHLYKETS